MHKVKAITDKIASAVGIISIVGYITITLLTFADIIAKKVIGTPIYGTYEIVERLMLVAVFTSFAYAQVKRSHINVTVVVERLPRLPRHLIMALMSLLSTSIAAVLTYAAYRQSNIAAATSSQTGILAIPLAPFFYVETIAMVIFTLILLVDTYVILAGIWSKSWYEQINDEFGMKLYTKKNKKEKQVTAN
jgi:TRAP-type C4-dicarboxylate transport system permease small subunit